MDKYFIGRTEEQEILKDALQSHEAEMVAVIGRRRVGKTYLIKSVYQKDIAFEVTGIQDAPKKQQLENFVLQLVEASGTLFPIQTPTTWLQAFALLIRWLKGQIGGEEKKVVFFDELPWMATHKSGFLNGFSYFWNSWAVNQNIVVVICGSAASWMIRKVVNNRGGLYNRITQRIYLAPFTLAETEAYLKARNIHFDRYHIVQLYMALGGIPHHLKEIKKGKSATQNINRICFSKNGLLRDEFKRLYPSLFANADNHIAIIRTLASKRKGLSRKEITELSKVPAGGSTTRTLEELEYSGFISSYTPYGRKKKDRLYRLTDEYSLFYLKFIEGKEHEGKDIWNHLSQTQTYVSWSGYAFESICLKHIPQIKKGLKISGIYAQSSVFEQKAKGKQKGAQIDLLIDRKDQTINLLELKFSGEAYTITKAYAENLQNKIQVFKAVSQTTKQLFWVLLSPFGVKQNEYSDALIDEVLTVDTLFLEE